MPEYLPVFCAYSFGKRGGGGRPPEGGAGGVLPAMRENLAAAFGMPVDAVSVKATTEEHLGFTGEGLGIAAHAVALIEKL